MMESLISIMPLFAVLISAVAALLISFTGQSRQNLREFWSIAAGLLMFGLTVSVMPQVLGGQIPQWSPIELTPLRNGAGWSFVLLKIIPGLELAFRVDAFGLLFASGASLLWVLTSFYSIGYMRTLDEHAQTRYFACFALALSATVGVAFSANLFTLFLFYEGLTLITYPLVGHKETAEAKAGARKYAIYLLGAAKIFLLGAIILTYNVAGTLDFKAGGIITAGMVAEHSTLLFLIFALFLFGLAKNALMPLHSWLPAAMVAPTPVSALLHAVAVVKTGVFSTVRVILFVFNPAVLMEIGANHLALGAALVTIFVGSLLALGQDNLKARLAFSTVSQLSYIILGASLLNYSGVVGGVSHITNHAVSKITLFFCAGSIYVSTRKTEISQLSGLAKRMPWTMAAFALASLSVIGIPPTSGFISKWYLAIGTVEEHNLILLGVLLISSLLNAAYLGPVVYKAYFEKVPEAVAGQIPDNEVREVPWMVAPLAISAAVSLLLGLFPTPVLNLASALANSIFQTGGGVQ